MHEPEGIKDNGLINSVLNSKHPLKAADLGHMEGSAQPFRVAPYPVLTAALGVPQGHLPISQRSSLEIGSISHWPGTA